MTSKAKWWTSGFFPGVLWYLYEVNQDDSLKMYAENYTKRIENEKYTTDNHDVGFMSVSYTHLDVYKRQAYSCIYD